MREEIIVSGRMNHLIDPYLNIWHWPIPFYLFVGGLAAGILFFAALMTIRGKEEEYRAATRYAPFLVPFLLILGLTALFIDLNHKPYFWRLYTTIRLESPMSWGAWTLMVVTPLSIIWSALNIRFIFPKFNWPYKWLNQLEIFFASHKMLIAWVMIISSTILGIYTGILFSAFNARPLWNTSILGPLFLASGLSAGAAVIAYMAKSHKEKVLFTRVDILIIGIELFLIVHLFMGFLASTQVQIEAASLFLGGEYTAPFWIFVVFIGMIVPACLDFLELRGYHVPTLLPMILVLFGSITFRFLIAFAGQASRYLY
jgi:formate-dependent nitrite reductase membrane component NrfD